MTLLAEDIKEVIDMVESLSPVGGIKRATVK